VIDARSTHANYRGLSVESGMAQNYRRKPGVILLALAALACGGRTMGDGFEGEGVDPGFGSGGTGSGATGSGARGSGTTGSGATGSGATGAGGFPGTGGTFGVGGVAGVAGVAGAAAIGGVAGVGAAGGVAGMGGVAGGPNTCPMPLLPILRTIHAFETVFEPGYAAGLYVYTDNQNDDTPWSYGSIFPAPGDDLSEALTPGVVGKAFQLFGYDFVPGSWGAGVGLYMDCIEANTATGITFFVKSDVTVRVSVTIPQNQPFFDGGECQGDYSVCVQNYVDLGPSPEFSQVTLLWGAFQGGKPGFFDPARIVGINFQALFPGSGFSLSVDELEFYYY
jgi:hypothetical protein